MSPSSTYRLTMAMSPLPLSLVLFILSGTHALQATPGSSCSDVCQSSSATNSSDVVCADVDYYSSSTGDTFKDCIQCLQTSNETSSSENDVSWFLYNLRYASAVCLYDFPKHTDNSTSSCDLEYACSPLQNALESGNLEPSNETEYGYCQADNNAFYGTAIDDCVSCLQSSSSNYMANFLLALKAGCEQEPAAGQLLSISGDIFSEDAINITEASNSTSSTSASSQNNDDLSTGAKIAIGVALGGLFLAALVLFLIYWCRQRQYEQQDNGDNHPYGFRPRYDYPKESDSGPTSIGTAQHYVMQNYTVDYKSQLSGPTISATPESERPESQLEPSEFVSNADYYDRLEGKLRGRPLKALPHRLHPTGVSDNGSNSNDGPIDKDSSALPIHPAYIPRNHLPGQLGGRASRNATHPPVGSSSSQRSSSTISSSLAKQQQQQEQQEWRRSNKPTESYAIQVFLNEAEEEGPRFSHVPRTVPSQRSARNNIHVQLASPTASSYDTQGAEGRQPLQLPPPSVPPTSGRSTPVPPPPPPQGGRGTPAPMQFRTGTLDARHNAGEQSSAPRLPSLILPSVPWIRVPVKRVPQSRAEEPMPVNHDMAINPDISGPLAFPDNRTSVRPTHDRIIEQTADRGGHFMEVPIGSGKSYLYG